MKESRFSYENVEFIFQHLENDHIAKNWEKGHFYELELLELIREKQFKGTYEDNDDLDLRNLTRENKNVHPEEH